MERLTSNTVRGHCRSGFERVQEAFCSVTSGFGEGGGAFCVYIDGSEIIHLWSGQSRPGKNWTRNTLATIFSTTKALSSLCIQILYDRDEIDLDAPVAKYWPEFGQNGKENALVRHVLTHTVGTVNIEDASSLFDSEGNGWDNYDAIADRIAVMQPAWTPGTKVAYHAQTFGYILGELVRRSTGRTIGAFFRDEVAIPLGLDIWIGTPYEQQRRLADILVPDEIKLPTQPFPPFNNPRLRATELPWGNASATAPSLARLFAMLSQGGEFDGVRIVSSESVREFSTLQPSVPMALTGQGSSAHSNLTPYSSTWALGYCPNIGPRGSMHYFGPSPSAFGHFGGIGCAGLSDPDRRIGISFVRSQVENGGWHAGPTLIDALYECLDVNV